MRKYYQAVLALTAAISVIALLFYRHEYNKLRFVLQVLNYFGTPTQRDDYNCTYSTTMRTNYKSGFLLPISAWQRVSDNMYVYSAYNNNDRKVRAIAFGKISGVLKYSCNVFFDNQVESISGKFSYELISDDSNKPANTDQYNYNGYIFSCKISEMIGKVIVGVQFHDGSQGKSNLIPIIQVHTLNPNVNINNNVICVAPPTAGFLEHIDMISFLAFHHYIGWNNFVVYDFGISHVLSTGLKNFDQVSNAQWNFTYTAIPWNFPYAQISHSIIRKIIETDCIYRTYNEAILAVTLSWNEYINLRYHNTVENVLLDTVHENNEMPIDKFRLNTLVFCKNNLSNDLLSPTPTMLKTTNSLRKITQNSPHYIYKRSNISNINVHEQNIGDLIIINRYQNCYTEDRREIVENKMLKFAEYMPNTKLFQYYLTGKLFNY